MNYRTNKGCQSSRPSVGVNMNHEEPVIAILKKDRVIHPRNVIMWFCHGVFSSYPGREDMVRSNGPRAGSLWVDPSHWLNTIVPIVCGKRFPIGSLPCSFRKCSNMARAAWVRRLPSLSSNLFTGREYEHWLQVRVTPLRLLGTLLIVYITPSIPAVFSAWCDRRHFPVTLG
jgi:hypothetical protein